MHMARWPAPNRLKATAGRRVLLTQTIPKSLPACSFGRKPQRKRWSGHKAAAAAGASRCVPASKRSAALCPLSCAVIHLQPGVPASAPQPDTHIHARLSACTELPCPPGAPPHSICARRATRAVAQRDGIKLLEVCQPAQTFACKQCTAVVRGPGLGYFLSRPCSTHWAHGKGGGGQLPSHRFQTCRAHPASTELRTHSPTGLHAHTLVHVLAQLVESVQ